MSLRRPPRRSGIALVGKEPSTFRGSGSCGHPEIGAWRRRQYHIAEIGYPRARHSSSIAPTRRSGQAGTRVPRLVGVRPVGREPGRARVKRGRPSSPYVGLQACPTGLRPPIGRQRGSLSQVPNSRGSMTSTRSGSSAVTVAICGSQCHQATSRRRGPRPRPGRPPGLADGDRPRGALRRTG